MSPPLPWHNSDGYQQEEYLEGEKLDMIKKAEKDDPESGEGSEAAPGGNGLASEYLPSVDRFLTSHSIPFVSRKIFLSLSHVDLLNFFRVSESWKSILDSFNN